MFVEATSDGMDLRGQGGDEDEKELCAGRMPTPQRARRPRYLASPWGSWGAWMGSAEKCISRGTNRGSCLESVGVIFGLLVRHRTASSEVMAAAKGTLRGQDAHATAGETPALHRDPVGFLERSDGISEKVHFSRNESRKLLKTNDRQKWPGARTSVSWRRHLPRAADGPPYTTRRGRDSGVCATPRSLVGTEAGRFVSLSARFRTLPVAHFSRNEPRMLLKTNDRQKWPGLSWSRERGRRPATGCRAWACLVYTGPLRNGWPFGSDSPEGT
jgi:hypothetical protein